MVDNNTIIDNIGLIKTITQNYYNKLKDLQFEYDDLYQAACLFLLENIYKYDSRRSSITTFIARYTGYGILKYVSDQSTFVHTAADLRKIAYKLLKENSSFYVLNNRYMNKKEIKSFLKPLIANTSYKLDDNLVNDLLFISMYCFNGKSNSLNKTYEYEIDNAVLDYTKVLYSNSNTEEEAIDNIVKEELMSYLNSINEVSADMFIKYYGLNGEAKEQIEIAKEYKISKQNVSRRIKTFEKNIRANKDKVLNIVE